MSFETTVRAFATALDDPMVATPAMTHGRIGAPDARRFSVYRNNVAVGLIGALEARYPVSKRIAGDELFRGMARAFVRAHKPRTPVMIAYGGDFPKFVADYLMRAEAGPGSSCGSNNLLGHRDPPPIGRSEERPSVGRAMPAPTRGGGGANSIDSVQQALAGLPDVARLENAWVEAYHAEDTTAATVAELAALGPDCLPDTRITFHPATRLLRFATPAASVWASAQSSDGPAASEPAGGEDALITRPDCDVRVRVLPPVAHDFALSLRKGATLIEAAAAMNDPGFDFGAHLVGLVESGAVASIIPGRSS
jgi:Putative DNA-binding domain